MGRSLKLYHKHIGVKKLNDGMVKLYLYDRRRGGGGLGSKKKGEGEVFWGPG